MTGLELLEFARGPALWGSLAVLLAGSLLAAGALHGIVARMLPHPNLRARSRLGAWNAYVYHIGLAIVAFAYLPHILFIERLTGLAWPAAPEPLVFATVAVTFVSLFLALLERFNDPVRRLLSTFDDWFSWVVVLLPLATGMAALSQSYGAGAPPAMPLDPLPVAIHLLSVELLFVWLPFGKLAHAFLVFASRGVTGAALARRGAAL
jgi:hypothetical protein